MKIKVKDFFFVKDKQENKIPYEIGEEYEVSKELYEEIKYYVEIVKATKIENTKKG